MYIYIYMLNVLLLLLLLLLILLLLSLRFRADRLAGADGSGRYPARPSYTPSPSPRISPLDFSSLSRGHGAQWFRHLRAHCQTCRETRAEGISPSLSLHISINLSLSLSLSIYIYIYNYENNIYIYIYIYI